MKRLEWEQGGGSGTENKWCPACMMPAKLKSGSAQPNRNKVAELTWEQVRAIAQDKIVDLNCFTVEAAMKIVAGTARSMGITVKGEFPGN